MKNLRTPLLQEMPGGPADAPMGKRIKRLTLVLILLLLVGAPIFIITTGILPRDGAGYPFYWFHDHVFLPIKGYTYTLFYPFSLSWWGPAATILAVWFLAYLARIPLTRDPHSHILRHIVRRRSKHRVLLNSTRIMRKWGFGVLLLQEIVHQERQKAMLRLTAEPFQLTEEETVSGLLHLTELHINLLLTGKPKLENYIEAAPVWYQTYMQIRCRRHHMKAEYLNTAATHLAELAPRVLLPLLNFEDEGLLQKVAETPAAFDMESIVLDLLYLAALHNPSPALKLPGIGTDEMEHPAGLQKVVAFRMARSVSSRHGEVDRSRGMLERFRAGELGFDALLQDQPGAYLPLLRDNSPHFPLWGRIALWMVLDYAALIESSAPALGFIESLESLDFEFNCLPRGAWDPANDGHPDHLSHPFKHLPHPEDFRWCAHLAQLELDLREAAWKEFDALETNPVNPQDMHLARTRVRSLYHAAGPNEH